MFNDEFFPTPDAIIEKMLQPFFQQALPRLRGENAEAKILHLADLTILDPSAGAGAILDYVARQLDRQSRGGQQQEPKKLYCCETDPGLKAILQAKGYRVLGEDFLQYAGDMPVRLILMNPPFSCGDRHVLHAFERVSPGGDVVALVNSESLANPFSRTRQQLARLITDFGSAEELGNCFSTAERTTDVRVSLIRLKKPASGDPFAFDWSNKGGEQAPDFSQANYGGDLMNRELVGPMLTQYKCLREQFVNLMRAMDGIRHFGQGLIDPSANTSAWRIAQETISTGLYDSKRTSYAGNYTAFTEAMRQQMWGVVLKKLDIQKFMTRAVRENFRTYSEQQGYMDFTAENVAQLVGMMLDNTGTILEVAVAQLFDTFTMYHKENRCHVEGWLTNARYKVNRRLVLPNWVEFGEYSNSFSMHGGKSDRYSDVDKVMCYLTGTRYETANLITDALETKFRQLGNVSSGTFDNKCESEFFNLRFFKKGTIHLEFKDPRLHQEFNLRACVGKAWLPEAEMRAYEQRKGSPFQAAAGSVESPALGAYRQLSLLAAYG